MNQSDDSAILITGANGNLGKKLLKAFAGQPVTALVRSAAARENLQAYVATLPAAQVTVQQCDYFDTNAIAAAAAGCRYAVHLVGIIKESAHNSFERAHVDASVALLTALEAAGVERIFYPSLIGADPHSANPCLATRGIADQLFLDSPLSTLVVQIPMVLGEGDFASGALRKRANARHSFVFRKGSLEQPLFAADLIAAIRVDYERFIAGSAPENQLLALAGPESLSRASLIQRAAAVLGTRTSTTSLPMSLGMALAWVLEKLSKSPPITRAMLGVLDHDDTIDPLPAAQALGIELTSLDDMLAKTLTGASNSASY